MNSGAFVIFTCFVFFPSHGSNQWDGRAVLSAPKQLIVTRCAGLDSMLPLVSLVAAEGEGFIMSWLDSGFHVATAITLATWLPKDFKVFQTERRRRELEKSVFVLNVALVTAHVASDKLMYPADASWESEVSQFSWVFVC